MSDARPDLAGALGAAAAGVGVLVVMTGRTKLALLGPSPLVLRQRSR